MIKDKISMDDAENMFRDCLDSDADSPVMVAGCLFNASEILETLDPIAYKESFMCYLNSLADDLVIEGYND
jgi:hypothetical protein